MNRLTLLALVLIFAFGLEAFAGENTAFPPELEADLSGGTTAIYHLDFGQAAEHFERAIQIRPEHPAAYFFQLMSTWYRLTYDSLLNRNPVLEKILLDQAETTVQKAKKFAEMPNHQGVGYLYWGGSLGAKGWFHVTRNQWVRAYLSGKKGYNFMQKVIEFDPEIYDAYLGVGMYEYYAATLGPVLKVLASFSIRGDRDKAFRYLRLAELRSKYVRLEASYFLWNAAMDEKRYEDALEKVKVLRHAFPNSPLFRWCEMQTLFGEKKFPQALERGQDYIHLATMQPRLLTDLNSFQLLLAKVYYHAGLCAFELKKYGLAQEYFQQTITQPCEFQGWKAVAYLRLGELFDLEQKRAEALDKYRSVLTYPDYWDSTKIARQRIREPFRIQ